jgi:adenine-specific DNA-methyltransferase
MLINIWYKYFDTDIEIKLVSVEEIPIIDINTKKQKPFVEKADLFLL